MKGMVITLQPRTLECVHNTYYTSLVDFDFDTWMLFVFKCFVLTISVKYQAKSDIDLCLKCLGFADILPHYHFFHLLYIGRRGHSSARQSCRWLCLGWTLAIPRTWVSWKMTLKANVWWIVLKTHNLTLSTKERFQNWNAENNL